MIEIKYDISRLQFPPPPKRCVGGLSLHGLEIFYQLWRVEALVTREESRCKVAGGWGEPILSSLGVLPS